MLFARSGARCLIAALAIGVLVGWTSGAAEAASDGIDPIVTGSIDSAPMPQQETRGSAAFRQALATLVSGDQAGAYQAAVSLPDPLERHAIQWAAIYYGQGKVDYRAVAQFSDDAPDFATDALSRSRLEQSLVTAGPSDADVIHFLGGHTPGSVKGRAMLAAAYERAGEHDRAHKLARSVWVSSTYDADGEKLVLATVGTLLTRDDDWQRTIHLLMTDRATAAKRMLGRLSPAEKTLANAGIAVILHANDAKALLDKVDPSLRHSPVFYFISAQRARMAGSFSTALADLDAAKRPLPDSAEWWYERRTLIRAMLLAGDAKTAYRAAIGYTSGPEGRLVEAHFHAGWIALSFLGDAKAAKPQFEKMLKLSTLPDSITQGNYWLGRTLDTLGDRDGARAAYAKAAQYGTMYYGLLARAALGEKGVDIRPMPAWQDEEAAFDARDIVRAVQLFAANGQGELAAPLLRNFSYTLKTGGQLLLAARLAQAIDSHDVAIEIADYADKRGTPLDLYNFPMDPLPTGMKLADVDKAAVYAIARQESKFRVDAVSHSGALGLMQLMPATAKETAGRMGLKYSVSRLTSDAQYNALLGSTYLAGQLRHFDGSLALAAAGYNAGAGNAAKWVTAFGDPRASNVDPVVWVELIPVEETRRYVQRVLTNYVIYRARLGQAVSIDQALRRIPG